MAQHLSNAQYDDWHYSNAVVSNGFVFISGCTGVDKDGRCAADPSNQIKQAFDNVSAALALAGLDFSDVVDLTTYHVELQQQIAIFRQIKDQYIHAPYPAWTAIGITELAAEHAIVEIKAIARQR